MLIHNMMKGQGQGFMAQDEDKCQDIGMHKEAKLNICPGPTLVFVIVNHDAETSKM